MHDTFAGVSWTIDAEGYRVRKTRRGGRMRTEKEHISVWEAANGSLPDGLILHHIDGDRTNNRLENLVALDRKTHKRLHCGWVQTDLGEWLKPCQRCGEKLPLSAFYPNKTGFQEKCKPCQSAVRKGAAA